MSYDIDELDDQTHQRVADELGSNRSSTVLMSNGDRLVFEITDDPFAYVQDDEDWIGRIAECSPKGWFGWRDPRPDGFDGGARKVDAHQVGCFWWQPPADIIGDPELLGSLRSELIDILMFGYSIISVSLQSKCSHGDWHEVTGTGIGGLGPNTDWGMMVSEVMAWLNDCQEVAA